MPTTFSDATIFGDTIPPFYNDTVTIAFGRNREDKAFRNVTDKFGKLVTDLLTFEIGEKDGRCMLPGEINATAAGGRRTGNNVIRNHILMVDIDVGMSLQDIDDVLAEHGLWALVWTTSSHNKSTTEIAEKPLAAYAQRLGTGVIDEHLITQYLVKEKGIRASCLAGLKITGVGPGTNGKSYTVSHQPIPKYRVMFKLAQPFEFMRIGTTQEQDILEWKERYAGVCTKLGIPFDSSCVDPSRLMYTPRVKKKTEDHGIWVFDGAALRLEDYPRIPVKEARALTRGEDDDPLAAFSALASDAGVASADFKTPNLLQFVAQYGKSFEAVSWLESIAPDDKRNDRGEKVEFRCPNADNHSEGDNPDDVAFFAMNASSNDGTGFAMYCGHDTCKGASQNDRLWYLDRACQHYGVTDAMLLREWCVDYVEEQAAKVEKKLADKAAEEVAKKPDALEALCRKLGLSSTSQDRVEAMRAIARLELPGDVDRYLKIIKEQTNIGLGSLRDELKIVRVGIVERREEEEREAAALKEQQRLNSLPPEEREKILAERKKLADDAAEAAKHDLPRDKDGRIQADKITAIWEDWTADDKREASAARLGYLNDQCPRIFLRPEGGVVRAVESEVIIEVPQDVGAPIERSVRKTTLEPIENKDVWTWELANAMKFKRVKQGIIGTDPQTGAGITGDVPEEVEPFPICVIEAVAGRFKPYPKVEFVSQVPLVVPVRQPDGSFVAELQTTSGYCKELRAYIDIDPSLKVEPLPSVITTAHVEEAKHLLLWEALRDFPFSDAFDGDDPHPIKLKETEVHAGREIPLPNRERGVSSRAHALAMILQPHMRHFIKGGRAAYHIDKSAPGTGAGFLMDVAFTIAEGTPSVVRTMSNNVEEFRKNITAILRAGEQIIFIDNINHRVDDGNLAAALTAGVWSDRVLGETNIVKIPNSALWVFAGNDIDFSRELNRRMVPIRLDANEANPTHRKRDMFKHFPLQPWLIENRSKLLWAVHVLIANWVNSGMRDGKAEMYSFDNYAARMSGVLECAGVPGFLATIKDYTRMKIEDDDLASTVAAKLYETFGAERDFSTEDAWVALRAPMGGPNGDVLAYPIPMRAQDQAGKENALGQWIASKVAKKTFVVKESEENKEQLDERTGAKVVVKTSVKVKSKCVKHRTNRGNRWHFLPAEVDKEVTETRVAE